MFERCTRILTANLQQQLVSCATASVLVLEFFSSFRHSFKMTLTQFSFKLPRQAFMQLAQKDEDDEPDVDFGVAALDFMSSMAEGFGAPIAGVAARTHTVELLRMAIQVWTFQCADLIMTVGIPPAHAISFYMGKRSQSDWEDVRRSAFGVLGDLARVAWALIEPYRRKFLGRAALIICWQQAQPQYPTHAFVFCVTVEFVERIADNLMRATPSACNNATWALGEVALNLGQSIEPHLPNLLNRLVPLMNNHYVPNTLHENVGK